MTTRGVLVASLVFFGGAVYGIRTEKMRVVQTCRDARLFMDGSIDANIEAGGINFHHGISIMRRHLRDEISLAEIDVDSESPPGSSQDTYLGRGMKFALFKDRPQTKYGTPAFLEADLGSEKLAVNLFCKRVQ